MKQLATIPQVIEKRPHKTERQLRRAVAEKRIPFYKIDGRIYFDLADIDAHDEAGRVEAAFVTSDEITQVHEIRARADAGATLAAQGISGALESGAVLEGVLGHFERIRMALKAIGR